MSERKAFPLRLSPELYDEIRRWADADLRSVNGQIEFLLREAVARRRAGRRAARPGPDDEAGGSGEPPAI
ncbi:MAG: Arc family DNA-binding protein [bacterium]|nr:Arc family DNA-binding protein [bacterium]